MEIVTLKQYKDEKEAEDRITGQMTLNLIELCLELSKQSVKMGTKHYSDYTETI